MSAGEIKTFEEFWAKLMSFFDAIVTFIKKALGVKIDIGATESMNISNIEF